MFGIFRRLFNRRISSVRQCPECGFAGSPKQFKRVNMTTINGSTSGSAGSDGSAGSSGTPPAPAPAPAPVTSDPSSSGSAGSSGF